MDQTKKSYRSAFLPSYTFILCFGFVLGMASLIARHGLSIKPVGVLFGLLGGAVTGLVFTWLAIVLFQVYVGPSGVRSYNFWGVYRTVAWSDINSVSRFNLLWLCYLVVKKEGACSILVPLFLSEKQRFLESIKAYAGGENPLVRALEEGSAVSVERR